MMLMRHWKPGLTVLVCGTLVVSAVTLKVSGDDQPASVKQKIVRLVTPAAFEKEPAPFPGTPAAPAAPPATVPQPVPAGQQPVVDDCPIDEEGYSRWRGHARGCWCADCAKFRNCLNGRKFYAVNPNYYDRRDLQVYSAIGYGVPVSVPLAPVVRYTYNYGWGIPSSRLTPVGATYDRWYPQQFYSQAGAGPLAAQPQPPMVYWPTDTTQQGFYYKHVPQWQPGPVGANGGALGYGAAGNCPVP